MLDVLCIAGILSLFTMYFVIANSAMLVVVAISTSTALQKGGFVFLFPFLVFVTIFAL